MTGDGGADTSPVVRRLLSASVDIARTLAEISPAVVDAMEATADLGVLLDAVARRPMRTATERAVLEILNNASNDWLDLLIDCQTGRGRTALRSARSLFEISLVTPELMQNDALAQRFIDHKAVVAEKFAVLEADMPFRRGKGRKSAEHARHKWRRRWSRDADAARAAYGTGFERGWDTKSVRERAIAAGRDAEYDAYRVSSATVHGGSGALFGTYLTYPDDKPVHRFGPNLMSCPFALLYGEISFRSFLECLRSDGFEPADEVLAALDELRLQWLAFEHAMLEIDSQIWPEEAPDHYRFVAVVSPSGVTRLYLHDPENGRVIRARPDTNSEWARARVTEAAGRLQRDHPNRQSDQSVWLMGARGVPMRGAIWEPAIEILPDPGVTALPIRPGTRNVILPDMVVDVDETGVPRRQSDS